MACLQETGADYWNGPHECIIIYQWAGEAAEAGQGQLGPAQGTHIYPLFLIRRPARCSEPRIANHWAHHLHDRSQISKYLSYTHFKSVAACTRQPYRGEGIIRTRDVYTTKKNVTVRATQQRVAAANNLSLHGDASAYIWQRVRAVHVSCTTVFGPCIELRNKIAVSI